MASIVHEHGTKHRIIRLFKIIQEQPFLYTKKELARKVGVHEDTVKSDIEVIRGVGYDLEYDKRTYRYGFEQDRPFEELKDLLSFSDDEQLLLMHALRQMEERSEAARQLSERLSAIFDRQARPDGGYTQAQEPAADYHVRPQQLTRPYLTKFQILTQAKEDKRQVILVDYRSSNSNEVRDRLVEPFYVKIEDDTLQAYDVEKRKLRHFLLSRVRRIRVTDEPWACEAEHQRLETDPFRIVNNDQVFVHLQLEVRAYNELVERYPLTKAYIQEDGVRPGIYHFECMVNKDFIGLTHFLLGFHDKVEIIAPAKLKAHLKAEIRKMKW